MPVSNASLLDLACTAAELADGWADQDTGEAVSTSETDAPGADPMATVWSFDTNTSADTNDFAKRTKDIGLIEGLGNRVVVSLSLYCDAVGALANVDRFDLVVYRSDWAFLAYFAADGLFIYDGAAANEVGTNIVAQDTWQEWTFDITFPGGVVANAVCDVYLDGVSQATGVDCSYELTGTDGNVTTQLRGYATDDQIAYLDWLKIGDGFVSEFIPKIMIF